MEDWAITYLMAFDRAKQLNLLEVADFYLYQDLLRVVDQIHPSYASLLSRTIYNAEEAYTGSEPINPSVPQLLVKYLAYYRTVETEPARQPSVYAARAALTLNSEPSLYHKRKRTQNVPSKLYLYGDMQAYLTKYERRISDINVIELSNQVLIRQKSMLATILPYISTTRPTPYTYQHLTTHRPRWHIASLGRSIG